MAPGAEEARGATVVRWMNEWTADGIGEAPGPPKATGRLYLCECGDSRCNHAISLMSAEYESVRASPTCFAIARNHENPETDTLVAENDRFATVERSFGEPAKIARDSDPRR